MPLLNDISDPGGRLISASRVSGTPAFNLDGERLGAIQDLVVDKRTGWIAYAVLAFGGFLGIGGKYHPLPWSTLTYDTALGGYVVNLDRGVLERAPACAEGEAPWDDPEWGRRLRQYYGTGPS